jgi:hypothetical protein
LLVLDTLDRDLTTPQLGLALVKQAARLRSC